MGRTTAVNSQSITRQAAFRLIFSLGLFVLLIGWSTSQLYRAALDKTAHERAEDLAVFYQSRLLQLERDWELQSRDFKVRIEVTRMLEDARAATANLQAFMTVQGTDRRFKYLLIQDRRQQRIFAFGTELQLEHIPLAADAGSGWHLDRASGRLYRVFVERIWLGAAGTGRMALFYPLDNALLGQLATPGIHLSLLYRGMPVASSKGQAGLDEIARQPRRAEGGERRQIGWSRAADPAQLRIEAPIKVLFTTRELVFGVSVIPLLDALILWFVLGTWLMRNARRINELGGAVQEFVQRQAVTPLLQEKILAAKGPRRDEVHQVAATLETMVHQTVQRERERHHEEAQRHLWSMVFANSGEAILITDRDNHILAVNAAFTRLTGYQEAEVLGKDPKLLSAGQESRAFYAEMWEKIRSTGYWSGEIHDRRKDGTSYPKWLNIAAVRDAQGDITHHVGAFSDITERKEVEERFLYLANHDVLTGLPNRHLLQDRIDNAIRLCNRERQYIGVLFLDLDNFKWVNDSLGHASGDRLLISVARRLAEMVRATDTVARLGGDEFVVLLQNPAGYQEIGQIAKKIIAAVSQPLDLNGHDFHVTTSIGISVFPNDGNDTQTLLKHADTAMYAAKAAGKNQDRYFDATMNRNALERVELEQDLRQAIRHGELELYYQPKLCLATQSLHGAEALIRWNHPTRGLIPPIKFIPLAEEIGLILPIGEWLIRTACEQILAWRAQGLPVPRVALNLSALQLESNAFVESVEGILRETSISTELLEFELTESMVLHNPERCVKTLNRLRQMGIQLSLDDFGTGYSSLSYLKRLPIDTVKIDRSFIEGVPDQADDSQLVRMIIALAKSVGLEVVAEGIETEAQVEFMRAQGCDYLQGYLIAKPMPAHEYAALLAIEASGACAPPGARDAYA